jgi:hypothetical protein
MRSFAIRGVCLAMMMLVGCSDGGGASSCGIPLPNCIITHGPADGGFTPCSDVAKSPSCEGGAWKCPAGTVPMEQCACHYRADAAEYCGSDASPF